MDPSVEATQPEAKDHSWDKQAQAAEVPRELTQGRIWVPRELEVEHLRAESPRTAAEGVTQRERVEDFFYQLSPILDSWKPEPRTQAQCRAARYEEDEDSEQSSIEPRSRHLDVGSSDEHYSA